MDRKTSKPCIKCTEEKAISRFNSYGNGLRNVCKDCVRANNRISELAYKIENKYKEIPHYPKTCSRCATEKDSHDFHKDRSKKNGLTAYCKQCATENSSKDWHENKEKRREQRYAYELWIKFGITPADVEQMLQQQNGLCAGCGSATERWALDHCHKTGAVRGVLCNHCNLALGHAEDSVNRLLGLAKYLQEHQAKQAQAA